MNVTTRELQAILGLSKSQLSRHFTAGRLRKLRPGLWDAASAASAVFPVARYVLAYGRPEARDDERARIIGTFRRNLRRVVNDPARGDEIKATVREFAHELQALTEAFRRQSQ